MGEQGKEKMSNLEKLAMRNHVIKMVRNHLKERNLTFALIAFQLHLDYGDLAYAMMRLHEENELRWTTVPQTGQLVFWHKDADFDYEYEM